MSRSNGGGARRDVAAGAATLLSARATVAAMAVVFIAISTRILTLREMAVFAIYNSLCALQAVLCSLGLLTTCTRDLPALMGRGDHDGAARLLRTAMATNAFVSALVASVLAWAARPLSIYFFQHDGFAPVMRWVALAVFLWNLFEANQLFLVSLQRFKAYGRANITCAAAQRITSLSLFLILSPWGYGLLGYMGGFAVGTMVGLRSNFGALKDLSSRPAGFASLRPLLRYSAPFYADGYLRYLYMQADQLLVALFLSPEILSLYFVARRFAQYYQQTVASTIDPVLAKVGEIRTRGREAVERSLRSASRYFGLIFLPLAAGTAAMSALFLDVAGGAPYREATLVLVILSGSVALYALFNLVTGYVYMVGAPADRLRHNMVTGISQLVLVAALLGAGSRLGISPLTGAALIALARVGALLAGLVFAHRQLGRYIGPAYDTRALPRSLVASLLLLAAAGGPQLYLYHPALVALYGIVGAALFVLVIRPAVRPEDLDLLSAIFVDRALGLQRIIRRIFGHPTAPST